MRRFQIVAHPMVFKCLTAIGRDSVKYGDFSVAEIYKSRYFATTDFIFSSLLFFPLLFSLAM